MQLQFDGGRHLWAWAEYTGLRTVYRGMVSMTRKDLWLIGGDERQAMLAELLAEDGHRVHVYGMERRLCCAASMDGIDTADCVILPLPALGGSGLLHTPLSGERIPAGALLERLRPGQLVLAGKATQWLKAAACSLELKLEDYFEREEVMLRNAIPTAEGAIRIAMEAMPTTVHGSAVLVLGFGRLGQALAPRLRALGAEVTVSARRREQLALAELFSLQTRELASLEQWLRSFDLIVNTIPARVLNAKELEAVKRSAPILDLASLPGGVDDEGAAACGIRVIHALALPGKEAPLTAARCLRDTVYHLILGV